MNIDFNKYFNLSQLSQEQQQLVIAGITDLVFARMADMIAEHLNEDEISQLETLSQDKDGQEVISWLNQHIPNFAQGINELLAQESAEIAQKVNALTNYVVQEV